MPTTTRTRRAPRGKALLASADFTSYLHEKAQQFAPGDLQTLVAQSDTVRTRANGLAHIHPRLVRQNELALRMLQDHAAGQSPQIPYYTICLLAVAVLYFVDPLDVIPDWIPVVGTADDALVYELAFALARPGVERYCTWKGISTDGILAPPKVRATRPQRAVAKRAAKRKPRR
jgi:uncharacterized membrane protein YkvA (DUF1232 family)